MSVRQDLFPETRFGGFSDVDGTVRFYNRVGALLDPTGVTLDVGCGRGAFFEDPIPFRRKLRDLRGRCRTVIGIDTDPDAGDNPALDEFRLIRDSRWPVDSESVSVLVADYVLEHVDQPARFFDECARVLLPEGYLCIRTANLTGYVALAARLVPNGLHATVLSRVQRQRQARDVFPTRYSCNSVTRVRAQLERIGFQHAVYTYEAEPAYFGFSSLAYRAAHLWHRVAPSFLRTSLIAIGRRPG